MIALYLALAGWCVDEPVPTGTMHSLKPMMIRPTFVKDQTMVYRLEQEKRVALRGRETAPFVTKSAFSFRLTPRSISAAEVELTAVFDRIEWSIQGTAADFSFDSARLSRGTESPCLAFARRAVGRDFDVTLDGFALTPKLGRLQSLYQQKSGKPDEAQIPYVAARAEEILGPAALANLFRGMFSWYPAEAVVPGRAWERQERFPFGSTALVRKNTVRLTAADDRRLLLHSKIEIGSADVDKPTQRAQALPVQFLPSEPGFAKIVYRKDSGVVESIEAQLGFVMKVRVQPNAQNTAGELIQDLRAQSNLRLVEVRMAPRLAN